MKGFNYLRFKGSNYFQTKGTKFREKGTLLMKSTSNAFQRKYENYNCVDLP